MKPFDAEKALAGARLVTRDGQEASGFCRHGISIVFPYKAYIGGAQFYHLFGENGEWYGTGDDRACGFDLFLADDESDVPEVKPATISPRAQIMAMLAAGWLADGAALHIPSKDEWVHYFRDLADDILRVDAEK